jgi:leader peptidase (prepilin peptidase)/N-methyltransferase
MGWSYAVLAMGLAAPGGWLAHRAGARLGPAEKPVPGAWATVGLAAAMAASAAGAAAPQGPGLLDLVLGWTLLALAVTDLSALRLPDLLTLPLIGAGLLAAAAGLDGGAGPVQFAADALTDHLIGAAAGYAAFAGLALAYRRARGVDGLGLGDAKLAAAAGAWLGWRALPLVVLLACGAAFLAVGVRLAWKGRRSLAEPLPFGAPLALAIWVCWLFRAPPAA